MGFKDVMKKIGKVALTAAPYVAAPFTGGASLMATGLANKAVQKWGEHDAKDAIAKGLAPSSFDRVLGKVGNISSLATAFVPTNALGSIGMLGSAGKAASTAAKAAKIAGTANKVSGAVKAANIANKVMSGVGAATTVAGMFGGNDSNGEGSSGRNTGLGPSSSPGMAVDRTTGGRMRGVGPAPLMQRNQNNPNLAESINAGRQQAIRNQPFREGYDITTRMGPPDDEGKYATVTQRNPAIYPTGGGRRKRQQQDEAYAY